MTSVCYMICSNFIIFFIVGILLKKKKKITPRGLSNLQLTIYDIKINSKVHGVCQKNNIVPKSNFFY